ncbi:MAG: hypothetical protein ACI4WS_13425 [Oscillospiraceae bacterium]
MSDKPKLPKYIVVLNIIMIVIILAICGLAFALTWSSKDLGWTVPTAPDNSASAVQTAEVSGSGEVTVDVPQTVDVSAG